MYVVEYDLQDRIPKLYGPFTSHELAFWWVKAQPWFNIAHSWRIRDLISVT